MLRSPTVSFAISDGYGESARDKEAETLETVEWKSEVVIALILGLEIFTVLKLNIFTSKLRYFKEYLNSKYLYLKIFFKLNYFNRKCN